MNIKSAVGYVGTVIIGRISEVTKSETLFWIAVFVGVSTILYNSINTYYKFKNKGR